MARRVVGWYENDAHTGWRHVMFWQRGELKKIKRLTSKRERREGKAATRAD